MFTINHPIRTPTVIAVIVGLAVAACAAGALAAPVGPLAPEAAHAQVAGARDSGGGGGKAAEAGKNAGKLISGWAKALFLAVGAIVALPLLARRDMGGMAALFVIVIVVGLVVLAPDRLESIIEAVGSAIAG